MITELRIGNLVEEPKGFVHKVKRIDEKSTSLRFGLDITPERLSACGFLKDQAGVYYIDLFGNCLELIDSNGYWHPIYVQPPELSNGFEQRVNLKRIRYFHQLQNLFFVLTGKELK